MERNQVFRKILFLTDGSAPSLMAQELAISLAKKLGSQVTVFHVVTHDLMRAIRVPLDREDFVIGGRAIPESADIEPSIVVREDISLGREAQTTHGEHYSERVEKDLTNIHRQKAEDILADAAKAFKEEKIPVSTKIVTNKSPTNAIIQEAEEEDYDIIIMGRSGQKEERTHLGSVAEKVARQSDIPVMIAGETSAISKILVPLDGSKSSLRAMDHAVGLAKKLNAELTLLYVQEHVLGLRPELSKKIGKGILDYAARMVGGVSFSQRLESGDPAKTITTIAEKESFDLIAMGSKGRGAIGRFFLGGVTNHVLHYTDRSVLVVK